MESTNILQSLLSNSNETRQQAEAFLQSERTSNPANLLNILLEGMKNTSDQSIAQLAALMYKKLFLDDSRSDSLTKEDLEHMKQAVMSTMDFSQNMTLLKRKGDILSKIFTKQGTTEELLKLLVQWAGNQNVNGRQFAMYIFEVLADCHLSPEQMNANKDGFMTVFSTSLTDREVTVRVAALKATISFLTSIDDTDIVMHYSGIIPQILSTMVEALKENEDQGRLALESMIELTNTCPEIWKKSTNQLVNVISQVMISKDQFDNGTRSAATEVILALSSQMPAALRKLEETKSMLLPALVQMLTEVEEDMDTWAEATDEKEGGVGNTEPYNVAINALNCLSNDLGEKTIMNTCYALIQTCIKSANWQQRQAGYMLMGLIAEACKESMSKNMSDCIKLACGGVVDAHLRVRYAGLSCLALLLTELAPKAQKKFHTELMPVLLKMMREEQLIKMQTHAVSTVINFANGLHTSDEEEEQEEPTDSIIKIYSQELFDTMVVLLKKAIDSNYDPLQEEVMNLLSVVAQLIEGEFAKYYNQLMPLMMQILTNVGSTTMQQMTLRARTIETMGYMIEAVAEQRASFSENVHQIASSLVTLLTSGTLTTDDPQSLAIKETLSKIAYFLKEDFHQYFSQIFNQLLTDTKQEIDIKLTSADNAAEDDNSGVTLKLKGFEGQQRISMNTSALESKVTAFKLLSLISESMGTSFAPYCEPVLIIMLKDMGYQYSKAIRKYAMKTCVNILHAVGEPMNVNAFQTALFPAFIKQITANLDSQDLKSLKSVLKHFWLCLKGLNEDNKQHKNYLNEQHFTQLGALLNKVLTLVREAKSTTMKTITGGKKNFDMDEEDLERVKEELAKICAASTYVMEISGQLGLNFGPLAANMVKTNLLNYFAMNLQSYKTLTESELLDATCFFCDFIEYSYHSDAEMIAALNLNFHEIFNSGADFATMDVKQTLSYGFGVFAKYLPNAVFAGVAPQIMNDLNSMISSAEAFSEENIVATESALGALGKIIYFQRQAALQLINDQVVSLFLDKLPLLNEEEEAQKTHKMLFEQILAGNQNVLSVSAKVQEAVSRIKKAAETQGQEENLVILCEEGLQLLQKVLQ